MLCFGVSALCVYECVCLSYFGGFHWFCAGHFSALEHVSLCVCVVLESLSRKSAAKQPEARKNSFTLSLCLSFFEFCFETKRMFTELQTHRQRFNDKSLLRSEEKQPKCSQHSSTVHRRRNKTFHIGTQQNLQNFHLLLLPSVGFENNSAPPSVWHAHSFGFSEKISPVSTPLDSHMTRSEFLPETKFFWIELFLAKMSFLFVHIIRHFCVFIFHLCSPTTHHPPPPISDSSTSLHNSRQVAVFAHSFSVLFSFIWRPSAFIYSRPSSRATADFWRPTTTYLPQQQQQQQARSNEFSWSINWKQKTTHPPITRHFLAKEKFQIWSPPTHPLPRPPPPSIGSLYSSDNFCFHLKNSFISEVFRCRFDWPRFRCARACVPLTRSSSFLSSKTFFGDLKDGARVATGGKKNKQKLLPKLFKFKTLSLRWPVTSTDGNPKFPHFSSLQKRNSFCLSHSLSLHLSLSLSLSQRFGIFRLFFKKRSKQKRQIF